MTRLLTVQDVAGLLAVPIKRVYDLAETRDPELRLPSVKIGRSLRFRPDVLENWLAARSG